MPPRVPTCDRRDHRLASQHRRRQRRDGARSDARLRRAAVQCLAGTPSLTVARE